MTYMTEERQMIQQSAREFAMKEVLPLANELDPVEGDIPMELRKKLADMGYFGMLIAEEYGGLAMGIFEYALVTEELARGWMSVASIIARGNGLGGGFTAEQRKEYLPRMAQMAGQPQHRFGRHLAHDFPGVAIDNANHDLSRVGVLGEGQFRTVAQQLGLVDRANRLHHFAVLRHFLRR